MDIKLQEKHQRMLKEIQTSCSHHRHVELVIVVERKADVPRLGTVERQLMIRSPWLLENGALRFVH